MKNSLKTAYPQGDFDIDHLFINEFTLKSYKLVTEMSDFVGDESRFWREYYSDECGMEQTPPEALGTNDFFDVEFYNEDITVTEWLWTHQNKTHILLDIYSYPGDNESGAIFLDGVMILTNSDQSLSFTVNTPSVFRDMSRVQTLTHIRTIILNDDSCDGGDLVHEVCTKLKERSFELQNG